MNRSQYPPGRKGWKGVDRPDIERGDLDGVEWWTRIHEDGDTQTGLPAQLSDLKNADTKWSTP